MQNEKRPAVDIRKIRRGYPFDAEQRRVGLSAREQSTRKRYDEEALRIVHEAELSYKPYILPSKEEDLSKPVDLAAARAAVSEALIDSSTPASLDYSTVQGIIDSKLPKTATAEMLDNVA